MDVDGGEVAFDVAEDVKIPVEREFGVQTPLHQDLVAAEGDGLADLVEQHRAVEDVRLGVADLAIKGAKVADRRTDVGVVDVAIDVVGPVRLGVELAAHKVGGLPERQEIGGAE